MTESPLAPYLDKSQGKVHFEVTPAPALELPHVDGLLAGAAEVDITPPPGMPKAGHSRNARDGTGFRTRLRARAINLRAGRQSIALVTTDLAFGSAVLHHLVADAIAADTDVRLPSLFLGATHTHAGPGQFHATELYNRLASNRPGFDAAFTKFLVDRIAGAVRTACETRRPAQLATGSTEVWGYTRNRSLDAYVCNENVQDKRQEAQRPYAAINPWLHLLRVDGSAADGGFEPVAAMAVFSIHGTGVSHHDNSYNADVWAYITGELGYRIERSTGCRAVVGAVEGTHGDMTPAVKPGQLVFPEAERVGRGIGAAAASLYEDLERQLTDQVSLGAGLREVNMAVRPTFAGVTLPGPVYGAAKAGGARENFTPVVHRLPLFRPGHPPRTASGPHGSKRLLHGVMTRVVTPQMFPHVLPVQFLRIGGFGLLALPFEVTVEAGRRVESALSDVVGSDTGIDRIVISSLANEYADYLTTEEEYSMQCYEGASNIFGPSSLRFFSAAALGLAKDVLASGAVTDHLPVRSFEFNGHRYLPAPTGARATRTIVAQPTFVDATGEEDAFWRMEWSDASPGDLAWHEPLVRVEALGRDGAWATACRAGRDVDDQGWHVGVTHEGTSSGANHRYAVRWFGLDGLHDGRSHRFVLLANGGQPSVASDPFD